ncbi:very short patch repair endonuclease [Agrobacterium tumefaciens]|jgi:DNA mismatch endonuclease (patch repair protein)|uniref:very short patch repair endonuclease n=1 Tax=Agrobacterium tumefaciens TaxID=358 RepID=UPI0016593752|nr:DNA mismatch endonuclease Vsr [Agrobacterium tumefaciens]QNP80099.1 DNA mismatch endonuclease Vsr [Agrobacterium tumefaciens]
MTSNRLPTAKKSAEMALVRSKNTTPELMVRRALHALGIRFRLHRKDLPGTPDIVMPGTKTVMRVQGCFWHGHGCSRGARKPKTNTDYWVTKVARNVARDTKTEAELTTLGWIVATVWECELKDKDGITALLLDRLPSKIEEKI